MVRVNVLILDEDLQVFTRSLQEAGLVQLVECPRDGPLERQGVEDLDNRASVLISRVERMISLLEEALAQRAEKIGLIQRVRGMLSPEKPGERRILNLDSTRGAIDWCASEIDSVSPELDRLGEFLKESTDKRTTLDEELHLVRDMLPIKVPLSNFRDSELTASIFFYIPEDRLAVFSAACRENVAPVHISVVSGSTRQLIMAMSLDEDRSRLLEQIHRFEGEIIDLPPYDGIPADVETRIIETSEKIDDDIEKVTDEISQLAVKHLDDLRVVAEVLAIEREKIDAIKLLARTDNTVLLRGWIPEKDLVSLAETISPATKGRYYLYTSKPEDEKYQEVPISLQNPRVFASFEWVTKMYGMPNYKEVDPTSLLVVTFAVFFGTCLTDAGYGIILAAVSFFVLRKMWGESVGIAFTLCGLATIVMGWLTGGWFGDILYVEYGLGIDFFEAYWVNPLSPEGTMPFLALALLMGIIHLELGHVTAILADSRRGKLVTGLVTHIGWILAIGFGSIFILWRLEMTTANQMWQTLSTWGMVVGIVLGVVGYIWERSGSARAAAPAQFMYDVLGHIADVISYSRLLALGISTAVNAYLIGLLVVGLAWPAISSGTGPIGTVVAILGGIALGIGFILLHLVNMGLNCLSAFVHTMRLHFAEYFGKFYEAGGDEFIPFKAERVLTAPGGFEGADS